MNKRSFTSSLAIAKQKRKSTGLCKYLGRVWKLRLDTSIFSEVGYKVSNGDGSLGSAEVCSITSEEQERDKYGHIKQFPSRQADVVIDISGWERYLGLGKTYTAHS